MHQTSLYKKALEKEFASRLDSVRDSAAVTIGDELAKAQGEWEREVKRALDELKSKSARRGVLQEMRVSIRMHALATGNLDYVEAPPEVETVDIGRGCGPYSCNGRLGGGEAFI